MYQCILCNYQTDRARDYNRHENSKKHKILTVNIDGKNPVNNKMLPSMLPLLKENNTKMTIFSDSMVTNGNISAQNDQQELKDHGSQNICLEIEKIPTKKITNSCKCGKIFSQRSGLSRHKKTCNETQLVQITSNEDQYLTEIKVLKEKIKTIETNKQSTIDVNGSYNCYGNTINTFNNDNKIIDSEITNNNTTNMIKNINVITYLNNNSNEAKPLKMLKNNELEQMFSKKDFGKHLFEEIVIYQYKHCLLHKFLGEYIVNEFKTKNPKQQQIWISDVSRLKFVVRGSLNKTQNVWHPDKKGILITEYIISPALEFIFNLMKNYNDSLCMKAKDNNTTNDQLEKNYDQSTSALSVIYVINQKTLHYEILREIAPHFQLETATEFIVDNY